MKKVVFDILTFFALIIGAYFLWWSLPLSINRSSDIKLGEQIIEKVESYQKQNGLPATTIGKHCGNLVLGTKLIFYSQNTEN